TVGLLRFGGAERAAGLRYWAFGTDDDLRARLERRARSLGRLRDTYGPSPALVAVHEEVGEAIAAWHETITMPVADGIAAQAGAYLVEELARSTSVAHMITSAAAVELRDRLLAALDLVGQRQSFVDDLDRAGDAVRDRQQLADAWIASHLEQLATT